MTRVTGLHHVSVLVSDTGRALDFYHGLLGLPLADRPVMAFSGAWLELGQGQQIHLLQLDGAGQADRSRHGGRDAHMALWVDDLGSIAARLEQSAVACTMSRSGRRALFCRDPDGNAIELMERQRE
jgi:glyoxylase I family protein